jgi:hypothetical protein
MRHKDINGNTGTISSTQIAAFKKMVHIVTTPRIPAQATDFFSSPKVHPIQQVGEYFLREKGIRRVTLAIDT